MVIHIDLGNEAMQTASDVSHAIQKSFAGSLAPGESGLFVPLELGDNGSIRDENGNTVGTWTIVGRASYPSAADVMEQEG